MPRPELRAMLLVRQALGTDLVTASEATRAIEQWSKLGNDRRIPMSEVLGAIAGLSPADLIQLDASVDAELSYPPPPSAERRGAHRFQDLRPIGQGGMGLVYDAEDPQLGRRVAIKFLRLDSGGKEDSIGEMPKEPALLQPGTTSGHSAVGRDSARARFAREARITGKLQHPGVIPIYEFGLTRYGVPYYTMRLIPGRRTLASEIRAPDSPRFRAQQPILETFLRVCDTVHYAHRKGIVHRDLKPDNIGLGDFGEVIVFDWGLAKDLAEHERDPRVISNRSAAGSRTPPDALGTPGYMSPEAAEGRVSDMGPPSDVFSLGVILYEILTGTLPFPRRPFSEFRKAVRTQKPVPPHEQSPGVPIGLSEICMAALEKDPARRPSAAGMLAFAVRGWQKEWARQRHLQRLHSDTNDLIARARRLPIEDALTLAIMAKTNLTQLRITAPADPRWKSLQAVVSDLVEHAENARLLIARRRSLRRVALVVLGIVAVLGLYVVKTLDDRRREVEVALGVARAETNRAVAALDRADDAERLMRRAMVELSRDAESFLRARLGLDEDPELTATLLRALAEIGTCSTETVDAVVPLLASRDAGIRLQAAVTLGALGPCATRARAALESAMGDDDPGVAAAARESFMQLLR